MKLTSLRMRSVILLTGSLFALTSCSDSGDGIFIDPGGGGGGGGGGTAALAYPGIDLAYVNGVQALSRFPDVMGTASDFLVSPELPMGLELDTDTGELSGTPQGLAMRETYTITATGDTGTLSTDVDIEVTRPARFAYAMHGAEGTVSHYRYDAVLEDFAHAGSTALNGAGAGSGLASHVSGDWLYVGDPIANRVRQYSIHQTTGALTSVPAGDLDISNDPEILLPHPNGLWMFSMEVAVPDVEILALDPVDGAVTNSGSPFVSSGSMADMALDPSGLLLAVCSNDVTSSVELVSFDPGTGLALQVEELQFTNETMVSVEFTPGGEYGYYLNDTGLLRGFAYDPLAGVAADLGIAETVASGATELVAHPAGDLLYVIVPGSDLVQTYQAGDDGSLTMVQGLPVTGAPNSLTFEPSGLYAFVPKSDSNEMGALYLDSDDGSLFNLSSLRTRPEPTSIVFTTGDTPLVTTSRQLYVASSGSDDVTAVSSSASGVLTAVGVAEPTSADPTDIVVHPGGEFLYVPSPTDQKVTRHFIDGAGVLSAAADAVVTAEDNTHLALNPSGNLLFVNAPLGNNILTYFVGSSGLLGGGLVNAVGGDTTHMVVDPTGQYLFAVDAEFNQILPCAIDPFMGDLTVGTPVVVTSTPGRMAVDPGGRTLYVTLPAEDTIAVYSISSVDGALTLVPPGQAFTGAQVAQVSPGSLYVFAGSNTGSLGGWVTDPDSGDLEGSVADVTTGMDIVGLAIDPAASLMWVLDRGTQDITPFSISQFSGAVSEGTPLATGTTPEAFALRVGRQ